MVDYGSSTKQKEVEDLGKTAKLKPREVQPPCVPKVEKRSTDQNKFKKMLSIFYGPIPIRGYFVRTIIFKFINPGRQKVVSVNFTSIALD